MKNNYRIVEIKDNGLSLYRIEKLIKFLFIPLYWNKYTITDKGIPHYYTSLNQAKTDINKIILENTKKESKNIVYKL
ncbi:hypothetical protein M0Q50_03555 [bacterium]|jgi:hypothetical protein|nr:hypothetical protein [bacterium]